MEKKWVLKESDLFSRMTFHRAMYGILFFMFLSLFFILLMPSVEAACSNSNCVREFHCEGYTNYKCAINAYEDCYVSYSDDCRDCSCVCGGYPDTGCNTEDVANGPSYSCGDNFDNDGNGGTDCADSDCTDKACGAGRVCFEGSCQESTEEMSVECVWYNGNTPLAECNGVEWCPLSYTLTEQLVFTIPFFNTTPYAPVPSCVISSTGRAGNLQEVYMNVTLIGDCLGPNCPTEESLTEPWWEPFPSSLTARTHAYDLSDEEDVPEHIKPFDCSLPASVNVTQQPSYFTNPNCCGDGTNISGNIFDAPADQGMIANVSGILKQLCVRQDLEYNSLQDSDTYPTSHGACPVEQTQRDILDDAGAWSWKEASEGGNEWKIYTINVNDSCWEMPRVMGAFDRPIYDVISLYSDSGPSRWVPCDPFGDFDLPGSQHENQTTERDYGNNVPWVVQAPPFSPPSGEPGYGVTPDAGFFDDLGITLNFPKTTENGSAHLSCWPMQGPRYKDNRVRCDGWGFAGEAIVGNTLRMRHNESGVDVGTSHRNQSLNSEGGFSDLIIYFNADLGEGYHHVVISTNGSDGATYVFSNQYLALPGSSENDPQAQPWERPLCYDEGGRGSWAICCGYSYGDCPSENNAFWNASTNPYPKVKRTGEVLGTLYEYYNPDDVVSNYVLRMSTPKTEIENIQQDAPPIYGLLNDYAPELDKYPGGSPSDHHLDAPIRIANWQEYDFLEFDIAFTTIDLWKITIFDSATYPEGNDIFLEVSSSLDPDYFGPDKLSHALFNQPVLDYSVDGNELYEWHHIKIPLPSNLKKEGISLVMFTGDRKRIAFDVNYRWGKLDLFNLDEDQGGVRETSSVLGIDRMYLSRDNAQFTDRVFCGGGGSWLTDLDNSSLACDNTARTDWTGSRCCGDDPHEYYADSAGLHACWDGRIVPHDTRIMAVDYTVTGSPAESHACKGYNSFISATAGEDAEEFVNACLYPMPRTGRTSYTVANPHTDLYSVSFFAAEDDAQYFNQTTTDSALVAVHDVKMQVLAYSGNFYGCNASEYLIDRAGAGVIQESNNCEVKGSWFCSATNQWLNKSDPRYAIGETEAMNLTIIPWDIPWYDPMPRTECCGNNACWNGTSCQSEYTFSNQTTDEGNDIYVCKGSQWHGPVSLKWDWDHSNASFCWNNTQCFCPYGDGQGDAKCYAVDELKCANETFFYRDNFCLPTGWNGTAYNDSMWTTRTALLATQLLKFVNRSSPDNYTLFCDYYNLSTNYWGDTEFWVRPFVGLNGTNNYCVLKYSTGTGWRVIVGASLWQDRTPSQFLMEILQEETADICDNVEDGLTFDECDDGKLVKAYWNNQTKSMIFAEKELHGFSLSDGDALVFSGGNLLQNFNLFLQFVFAKIRNTVVHLLGLQGEETQHLVVEEDFSKLYLFKEKQKEVKGIVRQDAGGNYVLISYFNATTDICKAVQAYNILHPGGGGSPFACNVSVHENNSWSYNVVTRSTDGSAEWSYFIGLNAWPSLGAMTRIDAASFGYVPDAASIKADIREGMALLTEFAFTAVTSGTPPDSYIWYFGDGDRMPTKYAYHTYLNEGTYNVTMNATYSGGRVVSDRIVVTVSEPALACTLRNTACGEDEVGVLSLLEPSNSHVFPYDGGVYENNICCAQPSPDCRVTVEPGLGGCNEDRWCVMGMTYPPENNWEEGYHATACSTYQHRDICMKAPGCSPYYMNCSRQDNSAAEWRTWGSCNQGSCVATISADETHVSGCDDYPFPISVCCDLQS